MTTAVRRFSELRSAEQVPTSKEESGTKFPENDNWFDSYTAGSAPPGSKWARVDLPLSLDVDSLEKLWHANNWQGLAIRQGDKSYVIKKVGDKFMIASDRETYQELNDFTHMGKLRTALHNQFTESWILRPCTSEENAARLARLRDELRGVESLVLKFKQRADTRQLPSFQELLKMERELLNQISELENPRHSPQVCALTNSSGSASNSGSTAAKRHSSAGTSGRASSHAGGGPTAYAKVAGRNASTVSSPNSSPSDLETPGARRTSRLQEHPAAYDQFRVHRIVTPYMPSIVPPDSGKGEAPASADTLARPPSTTESHHHEQGPGGSSSGELEASISAPAIMNGHPAAFTIAGEAFLPMNSAHAAPSAAKEVPLPETPASTEHGKAKLEATVSESMLTGRGADNASQASGAGGGSEQGTAPSVSTISPTMSDSQTRAQSKEQENARVDPARVQAMEEDSSMAKIGLAQLKNEADALEKAVKDRITYRDQLLQRSHDRMMGGQKASNSLKL